ncbi:MAG: hypothetical protein L0J57_11710 [Brachybacterium sp.]|nr:hypothetical protein [Brachybacterium sp.]MDN6329334.1 hypothetical protein [Brachybacterium sp.]
MNKKVLAWVCAAAIVLLLGFGGAFAYGLFDAIFESPAQGLITLVGTTFAIIALLVGSFIKETVTERRKRKRGAPESRSSRQQ